MCYTTLLITIQPVTYVVVILAPGEECEGNGFVHVCLSFCISVQTRNSKTTAPIYLIFYT